MQEGCIMLFTYYYFFVLPERKRSVELILGDPRAVSRVARIGATKVFKYLKTFVAPILSTRLTAPGSLRMG